MLVTTGSSLVLMLLPNWARAEVKMYGIIDLNMETVSHVKAGQQNTSMRSSGRNGSRWGLMGSEELDNGMKAVFQLETGFNPRTGYDDGRLFQRTAMLGLTARWGELTFGRQYTSAFSLAGQFAPMDFGPQYESSSRFVPVRADNAIRYRGKFSHVEAIGYYSFSDIREQRENDADTTASFGFGLKVEYGSYKFLGTYDHIRQLPGALTIGDIDNFIAGIRADYDALLLRAIYRHRKEERLQGKDVKSHLFAVGAGYQFTTATRADIGYYQEKFIDAPSGYLGTTKDTWRQVSLRFSHDLSKRTMVYLTMAHARGGAISLGSNGDVGGEAYALGKDKTSQSAVALGIRHSF